MANDFTVSVEDPAEVAETPLFYLGRNKGFRIPSSCLAQGKCRECIVQIAEGGERLSPRTPPEKHLAPGYRLSCQAFVEKPGAVRFTIPEKNPMQIQLESSLDSGNAHTQAAGQPVSETLGLAIDVGTTTVALELVDLPTGNRLSRGAFENGQCYAGSDIMARIVYDAAVGGRELQRVLMRQINHFLESLKFPARNICKVVVSGNSTMRDLFFGLPVNTIGQSPYRSVTQFELDSGQRDSTEIRMPARKLRLKVNPDAEVIGLPIIAGHIGADMVACLTAVDFFNSDKTVAVMDIGTNTEVVVGNRHRAMAASCPAGPAFEGGGLRHGMPGLTGAMEHFILQDGAFRWRVIGGGEPVGICGSGYVSLLALLRRHQLMNTYGRLESGDEAIQFDTPRPVGLYESDINELAQAKGANAAGLQILFNRYGIRFDEVEVFYVAGGFGRHLDLEAAQEIGLLPHLAPGKMVQIGNASLHGAAKVLRGEADLETLNRQVGEVEHVELETDPQFFDYFTFGCQFAPIGFEKEVEPS